MSTSLKRIEAELAQLLLDVSSTASFTPAELEARRMNLENELAKLVDKAQRVDSVYGRDTQARILAAYDTIRRDMLKAQIASHYRPTSAPKPKTNNTNHDAELEAELLQQATKEQEKVAIAAEKMAAELEQRKAQERAEFLKAREEKLQREDDERQRRAAQEEKQVRAAMREREERARQEQAKREEARRQQLPFGHVHHVTGTTDFYSKTVGLQTTCCICWSASWCGPCRMMKPVLAQLAAEFTSLLFLDVVSDDPQNTDIYRSSGIQGFPTFDIHASDGKLVQRVVGADVRKLRDAITHWAAVQQDELLQKAMRLSTTMTDDDDVGGGRRAESPPRAKPNTQPISTTTLSRISSTTQPNNEENDEKKQFTPIQVTLQSENRPDMTMGISTFGELVKAIYTYVGSNITFSISAEGRVVASSNSPQPVSDDTSLRHLFGETDHMVLVIPAIVNIKLRYQTEAGQEQTVEVVLPTSCTVGTLKAMARETFHLHDYNVKLLFGGAKLDPDSTLVVDLRVKSGVTVVVVRGGIDPNAQQQLLPAVPFELHVASIANAIKVTVTCKGRSDAVVANVSTLAQLADLVCDVAKVSIPSSYVAISFRGLLLRGNHTEQSLRRLLLDGQHDDDDVQATLTIPPLQTLSITLRYRKNVHAGMNSDVNTDVTFPIKIKLSQFKRLAMQKLGISSGGEVKLVYQGSVLGPDTEEIVKLNLPKGAVVMVMDDLSVSPLTRSTSGGGDIPLIVASFNLRQHVTQQQGGGAGMVMIKEDPFSGRPCPLSPRTRNFLHTARELYCDTNELNKLQSKTEFEMLEKRLGLPNGRGVNLQEWMNGA